MSTTPTTPTRDRDADRRRDRMRRLLRTLDRAIAIVEILRRERDALYRETDLQEGSES